jgi:hypothetical protein
MEARRQARKSIVELQIAETLHGAGSCNQSVALSTRDGRGNRL